MTQNSSVGQDKCPVLWKAVGDELVFCGRVSNTETVTVAVTAFIDTLHQYRRILIDTRVKLDLKGAGWLAAFPEPNRAVQLRSGEDSQDLITASEALEAAADKHPYNYDFLGKAIDTGFRVASLATPERFVLSVQLARLLVGAESVSSVGSNVRLGQPIPLKGVNGGEPYPVLFVDTMTHLRAKTIRIKERELLNQNGNPGHHALNDYLIEYCKVVGTDEVSLPKDGDCEAPEPPDSYVELEPLISTHLRQEQYREPSGNEVPTYDENGDLSAAEDLAPPEKHCTLVGKDWHPQTAPASGWLNLMPGRTKNETGKPSRAKWQTTINLSYYQDFTGGVARWGGFEPPTP